MTDDEPRGLVLPIALARDVEYQSAIVAVEGNPEFDISIDSGGRKIDVGELVDADYQVGRRLLGPAVSLVVRMAAHLADHRAMTRLNSADAYRWST